MNIPVLHYFIIQYALLEHLLSSYVLAKHESFIGMSIWALIASAFEHKEQRQQTAAAQWTMATLCTISIPTLTSHDPIS